MRRFKKCKGPSLSEWFRRYPCPSHLRCGLNEWRHFALHYDRESNTISALFVPRACAAQISNSQFGLLAAVRCAMRRGPLCRTKPPFAFTPRRAGRCAEYRRKDRHLRVGRTAGAVRLSWATIPHHPRIFSGLR